MTATLIDFPSGKPSVDSDPDLAVKAADGDRHAFGELVRRHQSTVRGMMRRLTQGHGPNADDLAQAAFLRAWTQIGTYSGGTFRGWICAIAYREFLQKRRKMAAEQRTVDAAQVLAEGQFQPEDHGMTRDLNGALKRLPEAQRIAIVMCVGAGLSHLEISMVTGWPLGTVKSHVLRGKQALRLLLSDYGVA